MIKIKSNLRTELMVVNEILNKETCHFNFFYGKNFMFVSI